MDGNALLGAVMCNFYGLVEQELIFLHPRNKLFDLFRRHCAPDLVEGRVDRSRFPLFRILNFCTAFERFNDA